MANTKVTALTELTSVAAGDLAYVVDISDTTDGSGGTSKKITRSNLVTGLAASGANSDITSLTALSTPLSIAQGGTASATASAARTALGLAIGTDVQAYNANLTTWAGKTAPSGTVVGTSDSQALTGKTYNGLTVTTTSGTLTLANSSSLITSGAFATTLTVTGTTGVTLPTTGTLATLAGSETLSGKTLTAPKFADLGFIADANGNELIVLDTVTNAVNYLFVGNSATGTGVNLVASGDDSNVDLLVSGKSDGKIVLSSGLYEAPQTYTPSAAATATLSLADGNTHLITMPAGNITIAVTNGSVGQRFLISITQDGTGSRTVTWFTTIKWAGGVAPTLTTTLNKRDTFGFIVTGSNTYDGFVIGQNI